MGGGGGGGGKEASPRSCTRGVYKQERLHVGEIIGRRKEGSHVGVRT